MKRSSHKNVFLHDFLNVLSEQAGVSILGLAAFFMLIPVTIFAFRDSSVFNIEYTHMQLKFEFCSQTAAAVLPYASIVFGALLGHFIGSFLLSRKEAYFYLSLGISRIKLILTRIIVGAVIIIAIIAIPMTTALFIDIAALGNYSGLIPYFFALTTGLILNSTFFMVLFIFGCVIAGNRTEAIIYSASLAILPTAVETCVNSASNILLFGSTWGKTNYYGTVIEEGLTEKLSFMNPLLFFVKETKKYCRFNRSLEQASPDPVNVMLLAGWLLAVLLLIGLTVCFLYLRKAQNIGISGKTPAADVIVIIAVGTGVFGAMLKLMSFNSSVTAVWIGLFAALFACLVTQILFLHIKIALKRFAVPVAAAFGIIGFACAIFGTGAFGSAGYVPDADSVVSAAISYVGNPSYMPERVTGSSSGGAFYTMSSVTLTEKQSIECAERIHEGIIADKAALSDKNAAAFGETVVPYDIYIEYKLDNGKTVKRYYDAVTVDRLAEFLTIEDLDEVKDSIVKTVTGENLNNYFAADAYKNGNIWLADPLYSDVKRVELTQEQREELLCAIASDIGSLDTSELYYPSKESVGVILFSQNQSDSGSFAYNLSDTVIYFNRLYENTMDLLNNWGLTECIAAAPEIESITLQRFNPYSKVAGLKDPMSIFFMGYVESVPNQFIADQDFGKLPVVTDNEKIQELLPLMRNEYFMNGGGYLACVKIKDSEKYVYLFLPEETAPDNIRKKFKE